MDKSLKIKSEEENKVIVISAIPLNSEEKSEIIDILQEKLKTEIALVTKVDKSVVAGLYIRFGDQIFDRTIKTKIERLSERLF